MILYDDKHNFLGMSSHTLGFLGYEDVPEFLSMNNDFSNLFVQKEGFIYDFDNFNWIDFVLYSGSANKSAIIALKNGRETKVDLTIKEIHLAHELGGIKKLYSVKLISDEFHKISGVPKSAETAGGIGGFSLSGLVEKEAPKEETVEVNSEESNFQNLIIESKPEEEQKSESFILNIAENELISKEEIVEETSVPDIQDDFKLDFFKENTSSKECDEASDFTPLQIDSEPTKVEEAPIDLILKSDNLETVTPKDETLNEKLSSTPEAFEFNLLNDEMKTDEQTDIPSLDVEPNFLKTEDVHLTTTPKDNEEIKEEELSSTIEESGFKLDFLKMDLDPVSEPKEPASELASDESSYNAIDHTEIIQQIKNDIKEIDSAEEEILDSKQTKDETFVLNIPKMPQVEQPLDIEEKIEEPIGQEHETVNVESLSSFQIQESKSQDSNKSFTSTLQSLFGKKDTQNEESTADHIQDQAFSFTLKSNREEEKKLENREDIILTDTIKIDEEEPAQNNTHAVTFSSLSALGLSPDDEFDLLSDFINDVKESIESIEQFTGTKDFDKINYSLVKIKSSAEILNLNAIIDNANSIRKHCITENSEKVIQETKRLKENIGMLEKQLEATAI